MHLINLFVLSFSLLLHGSAKKPHTVSKHATKIVRHKAVHIKHRAKTSQPVMVDTGDTTPEELLDFAKSNIGMPYRFGSANPQKGFDCSGFVTYVFNHFGIPVPRGSADYGSVQQRVALEDAQPGDLIFFTGTNKRLRRVGHMGIIIKGFSDTLQFIHSSSGDAHGVTISPLNAKYLARLVKIIRVFPQADDQTPAIITAATDK